MVFAGVYIMDARTEPGPGPLLNRELKAAEGVRAGLGPPLGGSRVVCRFGLFLIDKIASRLDFSTVGRTGICPRSRGQKVVSGYPRNIGSRMSCRKLSRSAAPASVAPGSPREGV